MAQFTPSTEIDDGTLESVADEAVSSLMKAISGIEFDDPQVLAEFDRIRPFIGGDPKSFTALFDEAGVAARAETTALVILALLTHWRRGAMEHVAVMPAPPPLTGDPAVTSLVELVWSGTAAVAEFDFFGPSPHRWEDCHERFTALAEYFERHSLLGNAISCRITAGNFSAFSAEPGHMLKDAEEITRLAARHEDPAGIEVGLASRAQALTWAAENDPGVRLAAFDAVVAALRHAGDAGAHREDIERLLRACANHEFLRDLKPVIALVFNADATEFRRLMASLSQVIWNLGPADHEYANRLARALETAGSLAILMEGARSRLEPEDVSDVIHASWTTWSFDHSAYRRAVPHGRSLSLDAAYNDRALELAHELTHVFTLIGGLGLASIALRAAITELELMLWTHMSPDRFADIETTGVAPLSTSSVFALARAEQSLKVTGKLQILQATWTPWLEGVAVYGELATDSSTERDIATPIADVLLNLQDLYDIEPPFEENLAQYRTEIEQHYATIQREYGANRLKFYLDGQPAKYLAGYIAVRAVVARWRRTLGRPMSGAEAFELLLHITRRGTFEILPPLHLSLDEFAQATGARMLAWIDRTAQISAADLNTLLTDPKYDHGWRHGQLFSGTPTEEELAESYRRLVASAMSIPASIDRELVERIIDTDPGCAGVMINVTDALARCDPEPRMAEDLLHELVGQMGVLPLAETTAPFWLNESLPSVVCLFRTLEHHVDTDLPNYTMCVVPLSPEEFAALRTEVFTAPGGRMTVSRFADLHSTSPELPDRGFGRNILVLRYGNWLTMQQRGLLAGFPEVGPDLAEAVETRLSPSPLVTMERRLADGAGAARVAAWIGSITEWTADGKEPAGLPVEPWVRHVRELADEIQAGASPRLDQVNDLLLRRVLDDDVADLLMSQGIRGLVDDVADVSELVRAMHATAPGISGNPWLDSLPSESPVLRLFQRSASGWDLAPLR